MPHTAEITIKSGADTVSFVPADYQITYDSLAGKDSGRSADGHMHISWILRSITKIEITLPPHELSSVLFTRVLGLVQGQEYKITYYDYLEHRWVSEMDVYTSTTSAGYSYKGIVNDVSFEAIAMMGLTSVPHFNPTVGTISTAVSPSGAGSVSGGGTYALGATVTLTATPATGYTFSQWNGGSTANPRTVTVTGDMFFTATFSAIPTYTISASVSPGGAGTVSGAGTYSEGSTCTLSVTPAEGYTFTQWNDGDQNNPRTFTVTGDATYTATMAVDLNYFYVLPSSNGTLAYVTKYTSGTPGTVSKNVQYSTNKTNWNNLSSTAISLVAGQKVYFRSDSNSAFCIEATGTPYYARAMGFEVQNTSYSIGGDITTLFNGSATLPKKALFHFFDTETNLTSASSLSLSNVSTLGQECFRYMFWSCTSLTSIPQLPALAIDTGSYYGMFYNCSSLANACYINPAIINASGCRDMFSLSNASLSTTPSSTNKNIWRIPMVGTTTVASSGLRDMFNITPTENTVYFANGTSPYYSIYWASSPSWADENWDVMGSSINVDFYCDGVLYNQIYCSPDGGLDYKNTVTGVTLTACDYQTGWVSEQYRAIYYTSEMSFGSSDWADFLLANDLLYSL